jgi:hypothetical protein
MSKSVRFVIFLIFAISVITVNYFMATDYNLSSTPILKMAMPVVREEQQDSQSTPGANVIKLFTEVIYCHSMVIPSFYVIKQHYHGNYNRMAKKFLQYLCNQCYKAQFNLKWQ